MAVTKTIRGVTDEQIRDPSRDARDVRPLPIKLADWLRIPPNMVVALLSLGGAAFMFGGLADWALLAALPLFLWGVTRPETAPLKMPIQSGMLDPNQPHPATGKPTPAQGIFFIGNDIRNGKEIWLTNSDARQHFLVLGTTGAGKALDRDAPVHTPTGWRRIGDLAVGDLVSTPDGRSAPVAGVYPQGELDICRITFADGRTAEACPDHLWEVHHKHWNGKYRPGASRAGAARPRLLRTRDIAALLERNKGVFSVRLPKAVEKPPAVLPLDPYLLGAMLGDGNFTTQTMRFSSADAELPEAVGAALPPSLELHHYGCNRKHDWNIRFREGERRKVSPMRAGLSELGLIGCGSEEKFIPEAYKNGSIAQRWALVQGLMDTDGSCDARKVALSFSTSSERLARDFQEVVWSLGGIAELSPPRRTSHRHHGERRLGTPSCRVSIRHPEPTSFFSLPRKVAPADKPYRHADRLKLRIAKVEMGVRRADAVCIRVDHPDHLFITENYVVTHNTESLLSFAANALSWGSGFLFCDGKGDVALFAKVYAMARRFGREDDLLVLNFMNGNEDVGVMGGRLRSNTMNPFSTGSSDGLTQMVVSLMDEAGGDGAMWKGRATAMLTGVMRALCWLRDAGVIELNVGQIRDHMSLKRIIELGDDKLYPDMPPAIRKSIRSYLSSLPGYQEDKREKQAQTTLDQHGYLEMQFTKILGSLADVYGHIFGTPAGEVDMHDVVLNRRILVIMLPALEKSGDEIANLGKIVVANLKGMMGGTLGSKLEGGWDDVVENRPTNSPSPFLCILDEVGYYTVEGMALMAAQARSLGFSMIYASQDIPAMKRLNEKEAASIIANTNTKIFMRTEEVAETGKLAVETGDKATRVRASGFERQIGETGTYYTDGGAANFEETSRVNFTDLKAQGEGEMHVLFSDRIIRARGFYANPEGAVDRGRLALRANHFIKVGKPSLAELESARRAPELMERLAAPDFRAAVLAPEIEARMAGLGEAADNGDEIAMAARSFERLLAARRQPIEAACAAVADVMRALRGATSAFVGDVRDSHHRAAAAPPVGGFGPADDLDIVTPDLGEGPPPRGLPGVFEDPFANPPGVPFGDAPPPHLPPRRAFSPPRRPSRINPDVAHGATVDDGEIIDMAERIASNDAIMRSLAALDFDGDQATAEQVETAIEEALGGYADQPADRPAHRPAHHGADRGGMASAVEAFDRATAAVQADSGAPAPDEDEGDGEGEGGQLVTAFLEQLLSDD